ncbi:hypothetical protein WN55_06179 [Dufourea novaeangliae]|uniref:Uncharacterized protein n=1 Tax=Dufourea novaeangliae TaxID=178035 RepID=A0A154P3T8_DUFNO|nr:hypothetical protein WN55_06179 [Dufourea novaeangliae]
MRLTAFILNAELLRYSHFSITRNIHSPVGMILASSLRELPRVAPPVEKVFK